ncbi:hypothetical protein CEUSTIGMA_g6781.t1 [Chlamydomonas eustigma]|uniref:Uncharacterized protein n=1 Tax=Chlamydomonas eustigma TaxID=1157962 RepID=A0A250X8U4_9CHLO|nr:hypothetical protein CEUSTIGMA_g6781.t1 [Chlamydomonas eustigma]|eukprot:GAX79339.1 hypothetical protein CEUSTIGMA_g6781.t1 [Chlamydomonas eustigma]
MDGPTMLVIGIEALVGRYPVFVSGVDAYETFDFQSVLSGPPTWGPCGNGTFNPGTFNRSLFALDGGNCSVNLCYRNATRSKLWGFVEVVVEYHKNIFTLLCACTLHIIEVGYTSDTSYYHTLTCKSIQHLLLCHVLAFNGWHLALSARHDSHDLLRPVSVPSPPTFPPLCPSALSDPPPFLPSTIVFPTPSPPLLPLDPSPSHFTPLPFPSSSPTVHLILIGVSDTLFILSQTLYTS